MRPATPLPRFCADAGRGRRGWSKPRVMLDRFVSASDVRSWMAGSFIVALAAAAIMVKIVGADERGIDDALLLTGRISFLLFLPAYAGSAAAALFGPAFAAVKRHGRHFGLAFASAHVVHLGLVAWLCYAGAAPPAASFVFFGIAAAWAYLLAIVSAQTFQKAVGHRGWQLIKLIGLNYIAAAFAADFMRAPPDADAKYLLGYLPFIMLAAGGFALRIIAWAARGAHRTAGTSG